MPSICSTESASMPVSLMRCKIMSITSMPRPVSKRLRMVSGVTPMALASSKALFLMAGIMRLRAVADISIRIPRLLTVEPSAATWSMVMPLCAPTAPTRFTKSVISGAVLALLARRRSMVEAIFSIATAVADEPSMVPSCNCLRILSTSPVAMATRIISVAASRPISGRAIISLLAASVNPCTSSSVFKPSCPALAEISISEVKLVLTSIFFRFSDRRPTSSAVKPVVLRTSPMRSERSMRSRAVPVTFCHISLNPIYITT